MNDRMLPIIRNYRSGDEEAWLALVRACPDLQQRFFNRSPSLDALRVVIEHPHMDAAFPPQRLAQGDAQPCYK